VPAELLGRAAAAGEALASIPYVAAIGLVRQRASARTGARGHHAAAVASRA